MSRSLNPALRAVVIENNIPVPQHFLRGAAHHPITKLEPGQSFEAPSSIRHRLNGYANMFSKKTGRKFTVRTNPEDRSKVRVWRLE
jgi:hypothetical protein